MKQPRSNLEIRQAAITPKLLKQSRELLDAEEALHVLRGRLKFPSDRLAVGLEFFEAKSLKDLDASTRTFVEAFGVAHEPAALISFAEDYIGGRIDGLPTAPLIQECNSRILAELKEELETMREWLGAAFSVTAGDVESSKPMEFLRHRIYLAGNAVESGAGGIHGIRTMIKDLI